MLDASEGLGIRFQYLALPLNPAEQASFFARWGVGLEELVINSMRAVDARLDRLEFFQEQSSPLSALSFHLKLTAAVSHEEMPHFRAMVNITLPPLVPVTRLCLGVCDEKQERAGDGSTVEHPAIFGISWEEPIEGPKRILGKTLSVRFEPLNQIAGMLGGRGFFQEPILGKTLRDLDGSLFVFFVNKSLAPRIQQTAILANEYILWRADRQELSFHEHDLEADSWPISFTPEHLADPWMRIMAKVGAFRFDFSAFTPKRIYKAQEITHGFS